jgi:hypothetical protein
MSEPRRFWTPGVVKRRLRETERTIDALCHELSMLEGRIRVPSPEDLKRIESGAAPFTSEALQIGLLRRVVALLGRASWLINDVTAYKPAELRRFPRRSLLEDFGPEMLPGLRSAVEEASQPLATSLVVGQEGP